MKTATKQIKWQDVTIYCDSGEVRFPSGMSLDEFQARAMDEYRNTGSIHNYYLNRKCTPEGGPEVSQIDFTGLDEALARFED